MEERQRRRAIDQVGLERAQRVRQVAAIVAIEVIAGVVVPVVLGPGDGGGVASERPSRATSATTSSASSTSCASGSFNASVLNLASDIPSSPFTTDDR